MSQVTEQSVRFQTALASIKLIQASAVLDLTEDDFDFLTSNKVWIATDRSRARRCVEASRRLHARIRKTRYMHKMRCLLINRRSLLLALRLLWKTPIFPSNSRFPRLCAKCLLKLKRLVSILPM